MDDPAWQYARRAARAPTHPPQRVPLLSVIRHEGMELTRIWSSEYAAVFSVTNSADFRVYRLELDGPQERLGALLLTTTSSDHAIRRAGREGRH